MKIIKLTVSKPFKYLWLKTVNDVNLDVHCARCLIGEYDKRISPSTTQANDLELKNSVYYLCGVSRPYVWSNNFHLAFAPSKGDLIEVDYNGIHVIVQDAKQLPILASNIDPSNPHSSQKAYSTCRNWQFAFYYRDKIGNSSL